MGRMSCVLPRAGNSKGGRWASGSLHLSFCCTLNLLVRGPQLSVGEPESMAVQPFQMDGPIQIQAPSHTMGPRAGYFSFLSLMFIIFKMGEIIHPTGWAVSEFNKRICPKCPVQCLAHSKCSINRL